jgi:hypothetical protein
MITYPTDEEIDRYGKFHLPEELEEYARQTHFHWLATLDAYTAGQIEQWRKFAENLENAFEGGSIRRSLLDAAFANQGSVAFQAFYDYYRRTVISSHVENIVQNTAKIAQALAESLSAIIEYKKTALEKLYVLHDRDKSIIPGLRPTPDDYALTTAELATARKKVEEEIERGATKLQEALTVVEDTTAAMSRDARELS